MKKYRFFFHYYKRYKCLSIHYKNQCMRAKDIVCNVPVESKWNKTQPHLVIRGFANSVEIIDDICYIN